MYTPAKHERQEDIDLGAKTMDELSDFFNSGNYTAQDAFVRKFQSEHRTLQQNIMRAFFKIMVASAEAYDNKRYDARNEGAVRTCKIMVEAFKKEKGFDPTYLANI